MRRSPGIVLIVIAILLQFSGCGTRKEVLREVSWVSDYSDIAFSNSKRGWIVGSNGVIITTEDGGKTWTKQESGVENDLTSVDFSPGTLRGWAAGEKGTVLKTRNGGLSWSAYDVGDHDYTDIAFPGAKKGWLASALLIAHTKDGGETWEAQARGTGFSLDGLHFISTMRGWACGEYGRILHTENGGEEWLGADEGITIAELRHVFFVDEDYGWAVGTDGTVMHTKDGGKTWQPQDGKIPRKPGSHHRYDVNSIRFIDRNNGWLVADGGYLSKTSDGGLNWQLYHPNTMNDLKAVWMLDKRSVIAVGINNTIIMTEDGGKTWFAIGDGGRQSLESGDVDVTSTPLAGVELSQDGHGWAVGERGTILRTDDGGRTWRRQNADGMVGGFRSLDSFDGRRAWAVGDAGMILHTDDGGRTWRRQKFNDWVGMHDVQFINDKTGWAIGEMGGIFKTDDAGQRWNALRSFKWESLRSLHFVSATEGWVVGWPGVILHTTDGGITWEKQNGGVYDELYDVYFIDGKQGWIVGQNGIILSTRNGGKTWERQHSGTRANLRRIYFVDINSGLAVGDSGTMLFTLDGGENWHFFNSGTTEDLLDISPAADGLIVTGRNGSILKYSHPDIKVGVPPKPRDESKPALPPVREAGWQLVHEGGADLTIIEFIDEKNGVCAGADGNLLITKDGGASWLSRQIDPGVVGIHFLAPELGWAILTDGSFITTVDGGKTWQIQNENRKPYRLRYGEQANVVRVPHQLTRAHFPESSEGWAVGNEGGIIHNPDGGSEWVNQEADTGWNMQCVFFLDSRLGWAGGEGGSLVHTDNGGRIWRTQDTGTGLTIRDIHFVDSRTGWCVGDYGLILHTTNGGNTWRSQISGISSNLRTVCFADEKTGWAAGDGGIIIATEDGGKTWMIEKSGTNATMLDSWITRTNIWLVGSGGVILKR